MAFSHARPRPTDSKWRAAVLAGLVAGVGMGLVLHAGANLMPFIGALYGHQSLLWGWMAHLVNAVVFAVLFVAIASRTLAGIYTRTASELVMLGVGFGAVLGILTGGALLPLWMGAVGAATLPEPLVPVAGLDELATGVFFGLAHLVYGALLGGSYAVLYSGAAVPQAADRETPTEA